MGASSGGKRIKLFLLAAAVSAAQAAYGQGAQQPRFTTVSIKRAGIFFSSRPVLSPGRLNWTARAANLVAYAYGVDISHVSGSHLAAAYTIDAAFDPKATNEEVRLMLRSMLAERFELHLHKMSEEADGYAITVAGGGATLKESAAGAGAGPASQEGSVTTTQSGGGVQTVTGRRAMVKQLADELGRSGGMPFWDRTGLAGLYDFSFRYSSEGSTAAAADAPSLATALRQDLGLELRLQKGPVETVVVDSIEQPAEN